MNLFYILICVASLSLGLFFFKDKMKSLVLFLFFGLMLPTSHQFMFLTSFKGIYFYDFFFIILTLYFFLNIDYNVLKEKISNNVFILLLLTLVVIYHVNLAYINNIPFDKYLLRDFRPFIMLSVAFIFIYLLDSIKIKNDIILQYLFYVLILKFFFFIALILINPFSDIYYQSHIYRYRDAITFVAVLFLIIYLFKSKDFHIKITKIRFNIILYLSVLFLIISNLRIIILPICFIYIFMHETNSQSLFKKIIISVSFIGLFIGYTKYMPLVIDKLNNKTQSVISFKNNYKDKSNSNDFKSLKKYKIQTNKNRFNNIFKVPIKELKRRYSPSLKYIEKISIREFIFGNGIATTFEIDHFKYRGLDTKNNSMDSLYLTFFIKYGILGLAIIFYLFIKILTVYIKTTRLKYSIIFLFLILSLTSSLLYHPSSIIYILFINLFAQSLINENSSHSLHLTS